MFLFSRKFKNSVNFDYSRKVNLKIRQGGEILKLSFLNSEFKKQQRVKIKNLLVLELLSLQKAFFNFELNKSKRKKIFVPKEAHILLNKKLQDYFLYNFSKNSIGLIKNLPAFFSNLSIKKQKIAVSELNSLFARNNFYFYDLKDIQVQTFGLHKLGFYKLKL
jgi:hypothetical protein